MSRVFFKFVKMYADIELVLYSSTTVQYELLLFSLLYYYILLFIFLIKSLLEIP